ncbi:OmpA family protein [Thermodesulfobacteriota bacterium]
MKNTAIIVLSLLSVAAIISTSILYSKHFDTKEELLIAQEKLSGLNEKVIQLNQEKSVLQARVNENAKSLKDLDTAQERIVNFEKTIALNSLSFNKYADEISMQKKEIRRLQDQLIRLEAQINDRADQIARLKSLYETRASNFEKEEQERTAIISALQKKLEQAALQKSHLKEETLKGRSLTEEQNRKISELLGEKEKLTTEISRLRSLHNRMVSELESQIQNNEVVIRELKDKLSITFVDRIMFRSGRATFTAEGREILARVGRILKKIKNKKIHVIGHTDDIPIMEKYRYRFPSNWDLSASRAAAVVRYLHEEVGIDPKSMEAVGRSFYDPVADNKTEEGRAQNRRVQIIIAPVIE